MKISYQPVLRKAQQRSALWHLQDERHVLGRVDLPHHTEACCIDQIAAEILLHILLVRLIKRHRGSRTLWSVKLSDHHRILCLETVENEANIPISNGHSNDGNTTCYLFNNNLQSSLGRLTDPTSQFTSPHHRLHLSRAITRSTTNTHRPLTARRLFTATR